MGARRAGRALAAALLCAVLLAGCAGRGSAPQTPQTPQSSSAPAAAAGDGVQWASLAPSGQLALEHAQQFTVQCYPGGYRLVDIAQSGSFLVVPAGQPVPEGLGPDIAVLRQPLGGIYLAATSAMDFFRALDAVDAIRLSGTRAEGWYIPAAREAMEQGRMLYAGKYSAPDYELIYAEGCRLAIESTMIYHAPDVKEQLERLGVPVLVERSSYEPSPLGRLEWIKLYGVLLGREEQATRAYEAAAAQLAALATGQSTGKTVAFFYINSNGSVNVRRPGDYIARLIEMAGGEYILAGLPAGDSALSTMNMQMEAFYQAARDADCLIYNSTVDGGLDTIEQLLAKSSMLAEFRAVQQGNVWCTEQNLFQSVMSMGSLAADIHTVLTQPDAPAQALGCLYRLR